MFAVVSAVGFVVAARMVETTNRSLEEISP